MISLRVQRELVELLVLKSRELNCVTAVNCTEAPCCQAGYCVIVAVRLCSSCSVMILFLPCARNPVCFCCFVLGTPVFRQLVTVR